MLCSQKCHPSLRPTLQRAAGVECFSQCFLTGIDHRMMQFTTDFQLKNLLIEILVPLDFYEMPESE